MGKDGQLFELALLESIRQTRDRTATEVHRLLNFIQDSSISMYHDLIITALEKAFADRNDLGQKVGQTKQVILEQKIALLKVPTPRRVVTRSFIDPTSGKLVSQKVIK